MSTTVVDRPAAVGGAPQQHEPTLAELLAQQDDLLRSILQARPVALRGFANATGTGNALDSQLPERDCSSTPGCVRSAAAPSSSA